MVSNALVSNLPKQSSAPRVETLPYLMATLMLPPGKNLNKCGQPNTCDPSTPTNKPKRLWMFCGGNEPHRHSLLFHICLGAVPRVKGSEFIRWFTDGWQWLTGIRWQPYLESFVGVALSWPLCVTSCWVVNFWRVVRCGGETLCLTVVAFSH